MMSWDTDRTRCLVYDADTAEHLVETLQDAWGTRARIDTEPSPIPGMARIAMQRGHVRYYLSRQ